MNGTADKRDDEPSWDSLFDQLGLEPIPAEKPKKSPAPPLEIKKEVVAEKKYVDPPIASPSTPLPEIEAVKHHEERPVEPFDEDVVVDESPELLDESEPLATQASINGEEVKEEEGGVRRRRRRRRRKKGTGEAAPAVSPMLEEAGLPVFEDEAIVVAQPVEDDSPAQIVGEAASELDDDSEDEDAALPHAAIDEIEDDSTEPLPDWKVVAWTDLVATLYRPQER